ISHLTSGGSTSTGASIRLARQARYRRCDSSVFRKGRPPPNTDFLARRTMARMGEQLEDLRGAIMTDLAHRRALLTAALGFHQLEWRGEPPPAATALAHWLDSWRGVGAIVGGLA